MKENEKWKPCSTCHTCKTCAITMTVQSPRCMMCLSHPGAPGWEPGVNYCPFCGRPVTAKAWEEHRARKRGGGYGKKVEQSPCLTCGKDDGRCGGCPAWRSWWIARWDRMRRRERRKMEKVQVREVGIRVGGRMYSHPEEVRVYMKTPPCDSCGYKDICEKPCPLKKIWKEKRAAYLENGGMM